MESCTAVQEWQAETSRTGTAGCAGCCKEQAAQEAQGCRTAAVDGEGEMKSIFVVLLIVSIGLIVASAFVPWPWSLLIPGLLAPIGATMGSMMAHWFCNWQDGRRM